MIIYCECDKKYYFFFLLLVPIDILVQYSLSYVLLLLLFIIIQKHGTVIFICIVLFITSQLIFRGLLETDPNNFSDKNKKYSERENQTNENKERKYDHIHAQRRTQRANTHRTAFRQMVKVQKHFQNVMQIDCLVIVQM